jgi:hypothetical protein
MAAQPLGAQQALTCGVGKEDDSVRAPLKMLTHVPKLRENLKVLNSLSNAPENGLRSALPVW